MVQALVICPQCRKKFTIPLGKTMGVCPHCHVSLIFEVVNQPQKKMGRECHEELITREELKKIVDETIHRKSQEHHPPRVQDIAILSTFGPPRPLITIEKSVDRLLRVRG